MIRSMTGFARAESANGAKKCVVETRSVNHRFLEFNIRMGSKDLELERRIKKVFEGKISRGYLEITVTQAENGSTRKNLLLDEDLVAQFLSAADTLKKKYRLAGEPDMLSVLSLKDIFRFEEEAAGVEDRWALIKPALEKAADSLAEMRAVEGEVLERDLLERLGLIEGASARIRDGRKKQEGDIVEKYRARIIELGGKDIEPQRALAEAAIYAERSDISEEMVRLDCHIDQMRKLIKAGGPVGRKMEFITQEMNREANTIGSKSTLYDISREVVEIKGNLEKIREQSANVE